MTAARNVLKLVVKSEWKSYSIQEKEEEAPGKYYVAPSTPSSIYPPTHPPSIHYSSTHYLYKLSIFSTSICPSTTPSHQSIHTSTHHPPFHLSTHLPTHPHTHRSYIHLTHAFIHPSLSPSIPTLFIYSFTYFLSNIFPIHLCIPPPSYLFFHRSICPSIHLLFHPPIHHLSVLQSITHPFFCPDPYPVLFLSIC